MGLLLINMSGDKLRVTSVGDRLLVSPPTPINPYPPHVPSGSIASLLIGGFGMQSIITNHFLFEALTGLITSIEAMTLRAAESGMSTDPSQEVGAITESSFLGYASDGVTTLDGPFERSSGSWFAERDTPYQLRNTGTSNVSVQGIYCTSRVGTTLAVEFKFIFADAITIPPTGSVPVVPQFDLQPTSKTLPDPTL